MSTAQQNKANLVMMTQILTTIIICDNDEDIKIASRGVAHMDRHLIRRYWERAQALPQMYETEMKKAMEKK